ncbi:MAG: ORF6C domain-containing protein [Chloroflexi bacterium]|nr:ORF6C domain-containing protein [Chloroflexota bacterium]
MTKHEPGESHYQVVYAALGDEMGMTSYKPIPLKAYETAVSFLDNWLLSNTPRTLCRCIFRAE